MTWSSTFLKTAYWHFYIWTVWTSLCCHCLSVPFSLLSPPLTLKRLNCSCRNNKSLINPPHCSEDMLILFLRWLRHGVNIDLPWPQKNTDPQANKTDGDVNLDGWEWGGAGVEWGGVGCSRECTALHMHCSDIFQSNHSGQIQRVDRGRAVFSHVETSPTF